MKLSDADRQIIQYVEHNGDGSIEELARALKMRVHVARYALSKLIAEGILRRQYLFNLFQIGLREYGIYCALNASSKPIEGPFFEYCCRSSRVSYVLEVAGDYQLQVGFFATDAEDAEKFLVVLSERFPRIFRTKLLVRVLRLNEFGSRALHHQPKIGRLFHFGYTGVKVSITKLDHEIMKQLANEPNKNPSQLARSVGSPATTVAYRFDRLRTTGVISGCRMLVDVSDDILRSYRLLIETCGYTRRLRENLLSYCERTPEITYLVDILGPWDCEMGIRAASNRDVHDLLEDIKGTFPADFSSIKLIAVFKLHKLKKYPFDSFDELPQ